MLLKQKVTRKTFGHKALLTIFQNDLQNFVILTVISTFLFKFK